MPDDNYDDNYDDDDLRHHLDAALSSLLAARALAAGPDAADAPPGVPDEALSAALRADGRYLESRTAVRSALEELRGSVDDEVWLLALRVEESLNARCDLAIEVAWRMGWDAGTRHR